MSSRDREFYRVARADTRAPPEFPKSGPGCAVSAARGRKSWGNVDELTAIGGAIESTMAIQDKQDVDDETRHLTLDTGDVVVLCHEEISYRLTRTYIEGGDAITLDRNLHPTAYKNIRRRFDVPTNCRLCMSGSFAISVGSTIIGRQPIHDLVSLSALCKKKIPAVSHF